MNYKEYLETAKSLLSDQPTPIALLANASAYIYEIIENLNWAGFYLYDGDKLHVGPFQGKIACATIPLGKGVCGEAAQNNQTLVVPDVLAYDNHIACDASSRSEVVIPLYINDQLYGVLDIDSPIKNRFDDDLVQFLEDFSKTLLKTLTKLTL